MGGGCCVRLTRNPWLVARCEAEDENGLVRLKTMLREQLSYFGFAAPIK